MEDLTTFLVYDFVKTHIYKHGYAPSVREIAHACFMGRSSVFRYLIRLEKAGFIRRYPRIARGIDLVEPVKSAERIPESL